MDEAGNTIKEGEDGEADVGLSVKYTYLYHIGSIAAGSLILALIVFARLIATIMSKAASSTDNEKMKSVIKCIECCLACLENTIEYLNNAAYAYMAVSG